jgi:hypothetical protein
LIVRFWDEIKKGTREALEVNKAFFREWKTDLPYGIGEIVELVTEQRAEAQGWEEIEVPPGVLGRFGQSRAVEAGVIKANLGIECKGYSTKGFYVERGKKADAVAYLRQHGLDVR